MKVMRLSYIPKNLQMFLMSKFLSFLPTLFIIIAANKHSVMFGAGSYLASPEFLNGSELGLVFLAHVLATTVSHSL